VWRDGPVEPIPRGLPDTLARAGETRAPRVVELGKNEARVRAGRPGPFGGKVRVFTDEDAAGADEMHRRRRVGRIGPDRGDHDPVR
jgi:hypothetical protein